MLTSAKLNDGWKHYGAYPGGWCRGKKCVEEGLHPLLTTDSRPTNKMPKRSPTPLLLKYDEAAAMLAVSKSKIYRMVMAGEIPAVRFGGNIRIKMTDLEQLVEGLPKKKPMTQS
jgi:excisionase family DNA binding protein